MDRYSVGGLANFLNKGGTFIPLRGQRNRTFCGADIGSFFVVHITPFQTNPSIHEMKGLQRIMIFFSCPFGQIAWAVYHDGPETLLAFAGAFSAKWIVCHAVSVV